MCVHGFYYNPSFLFSFSFLYIVASVKCENLLGSNQVDVGVGWVVINP